MKASCIAVAGLALVIAIGCGGNEQIEQGNKAKVSGKVTLDGQPLRSGRISFDARNGQPPDACDILDGKYEGEAPVGKVKVSLTSTKQTTWKEVTGGTASGPGYDDPTTIDILPERYKGINRDVKPGKENVFDFDMKSR